MRITFVLPFPPLNPVGGIRVVYEYANHLYGRGHTVVVVYPNDWRRRQSLSLLRRSYWRNRGQTRRFDGRPSWFDLASPIASRAIPSLDPTYLPGADVIFATGWQTAQVVSDADPRCGSKFQLIQHFETWAGPRAEVERSWKLPLHKVVISRWLLDVAHELGEEGRATYIPNGMNFESFFIEKELAERSPAHVAMLVHKAKWKGADDGLRALSLAHEQRPDLQATLFSTSYKPRNLPSWATYRRRVLREDLRGLYNDASIYLHPSLEEGWPLPPAEAMACGCALVATDNPGVLDYAEPDRTALIAARTDVQGLAEAIVRLVDDDALRLQIAAAGHRAISEYTWGRAVDALESLLHQRVRDA